MTKEDGWIDRQLPEDGEVFLDHVGYFSEDLAAPGEQLARLGFQVSPVNVQFNADPSGALVPAGTSNRLVWLKRGFIEVLAATSDTALAAQLTSAVARYAGFHVIAMAHADMAERREYLIANGFAMQPAVNLRRRVDTPGGERRVAYTVLRTEPGVMAEGRVQMLTHHTPELLWKPGVTGHENRVEALTDLLICVADPDEASRRFARFTERAVAADECGAAIALDRGRIVFIDPDQGARLLPGFNPPSVPFIAGQALRSADLRQTGAVLAKAGIQPQYADAYFICIGPADALGGYLLFHAAATRVPWCEFATARQRVAVR